MKLVVIAGPANSGKMPLARHLAAEHPEYKIVHRDDIRAMLGNPVGDEGEITHIMYSVAKQLLINDHTPVIVAWNLEPFDRLIWEQLSFAHSVPLEWLDVREPEVAAMIPPMVVPAPQPNLRGPDLLATVKEFARWHHLNELTIFNGGKPSDSEIDFEVIAWNTIARALAATATEG